MAREMKDSGIEWIGEIPEEWTAIRVKNKYTNHKDIVGDYIDEYERLALTMNGVIKRSKNDSEGLQPAGFRNYQILREKELVFKLIDLENVSTSRVGLSPYNGIVSPAYIVLNNTNESRYGEYYFLSMWQREVFNHLGGDGVRSALNAKDLLNLPYLDVPLATQQRIVDYLDEKCKEIDSIIENTKVTIEEYKKYKQSIITEAVTKGLDPNVEMKDSGIEWIGEIPKHWKIYTLTQIFDQVKCKNSFMKETNLLSLSYGRIIQKDINKTGGLLPENFEGYNIIENGDIVLRLTDLQNDHTSLRVGLATQKGIITSAYITIRNKSENNCEYLYYYLHSFDIYKGFYGMGSGVRQGLTYDGIKYLKFALPTKQEQEQTIKYLNSMEEQINNLILQKQQIITELESYKKSLIYECVTGKKEV